MPPQFDILTVHTRLAASNDSEASTGRRFSPESFNRLVRSSPVKVHSVSAWPKTPQVDSTNDSALAAYTYKLSAPPLSPPLDVARDVFGRDDPVTLPDFEHWVPPRAPAPLAERTAPAPSESDLRGDDMAFRTIERGRTDKENEGKSVRIVEPRRTERDHDEAIEGSIDPPRKRRRGQGVDVGSSTAPSLRRSSRSSVTKRVDETADKPAGSTATTRTSRMLVPATPVEQPVPTQSDKLLSKPLRGLQRTGTGTAGDAVEAERTRTARTRRVTIDSIKEWIPAVRSHPCLGLVIRFLRSPTDHSTSGVLTDARRFLRQPWSHRQPPDDPDLDPPRQHPSRVVHSFVDPQYVPASARRSDKDKRRKGGNGLDLEKESRATFEFLRKGRMGSWLIPVLIDDVESQSGEGEVSGRKGQGAGTKRDRAGGFLERIPGISRPVWEGPEQASTDTRQDDTCANESAIGRTKDGARGGGSRRASRATSNRPRTDSEWSRTTPRQPGSNDDVLPGPPLGDTASSAEVIEWTRPRLEAVWTLLNHFNRTGQFGSIRGTIHFVASPDNGSGRARCGGGRRGGGTGGTCLLKITMNAHLALAFRTLLSVLSPATLGKMGLAQPRARRPAEGQQADDEHVEKGGAEDRAKRRRGERSSETDDGEPESAEDDRTKWLATARLAWVDEQGRVVLLA